MSRRCFAFVYLFLCLSVATLVGQAASGKGGTAAPGEKPAWTNVAIKTVAPEYPYTERVKYHQGNGLYLATIDVKTGLVTDVTVKKSTGWSVLDNTVIKALRQWRFKPGTVNAIRFPATFEMAGSEAEAMARIRRYQKSER